MNFYLFQLLNQFAGKIDWFDDFMEFFAQDIVWIMIVVLVLLWLTGRESNQKTVFYACLTALIALLTARLLISPEVNQPRPFVTHQVNQLITHASDASFPSDHATLAFSLAFSILFVKRKTGFAFLTLAIVTGIARIYVGVHYPADILGAMALSFIVSFIVWKMSRRLDAIPSFFIRLYRKITTRISFLPRP